MTSKQSPVAAMQQERAPTPNRRIIRDTQTEQLAPRQEDFDPWRLMSQSPHQDWETALDTRFRDDHSLAQLEASQEQLFVGINPFAATRWRSSWRAPRRGNQDQPLAEPATMPELPILLSSSFQHPPGRELRAQSAPPPQLSKTKHKRKSRRHAKLVVRNPDTTTIPPAKFLHDCMRCKNLKVTCIFEPETQRCARCANGDHDCIVQGGKQYEESLVASRSLFFPCCSSAHE
ncbi:hypothetical protein R3P38DRAFT_823135 [Favolaschia claudopus]|uniref:Zn(2)-C6 fungal-type domain-containing protein n=1 Tax=Favolaschia claudopus TaxID=2862362 RepID=A0AAW0BZ90_9AGAR